jgi:hypothetical protein
VEDILDQPNGDPALFQWVITANLKNGTAIEQEPCAIEINVMLCNVRPVLLLIPLELHRPPKPAFLSHQVYLHV